jgi:Conserved region of Rad21 / Rec8 like protein
VITLLRQRLTALESQGVEAPALSLLQLTANLSRLQAARLFYQVCVCASNNFIITKQEEMYGDILITRGPFL